MTFDYSTLYIGGKWIEPATTATIAVHSPTTEQLIGSVPDGAEADIDRAVAAARAAFDDPVGWATWSPSERADVIERFALELESRSEETARRVSSQNGMPIGLARQFEGAFPAVMLRYFADLASTSPQDEIRPGLLGGSTLVSRLPVGVVGAIVPWNVPQAISFLKLAPALAAGCTVVLKPAPETVLDAFLMAESAEAAGLPPGVLNVVPAGREVGAYLVSHPGVDKVSFTGSTAAGRGVAEACGRLLRPVTLELGGKSAAVVLDDADLDSTIEKFIGATMINNGQICWLNTRILAPKSRYQEILDTVTDIIASLTVGDPLSDSTQVGPLVSARQRQRVEGYIAKGLADGARLTTGGGRPSGDGWFVEPTVFADVDPRAVIAQEEIFGPVLSVIPYTDETQAIAIANDSEYGLGGTVWTADPDRGTAVARRIHSGTVGINGYANDPTAPFGGIKNSGLGRELGPEGLAGYQYPMSIYLDAGTA
ncbi:aldehyde dehydrogenase [Rhodococcus sp. ACS1]|uniref:aldehyde dehydrogenase n=1 Tax=Rhodococcus sp. ACS1 TaxID=2028570 RepID=UPI000BB0D087|nr:aldehyde dehydrogenase [Rhodococcus sp. ACS1]PBC48241.1 aldehyde dehydrogenase [Rhodococcus sp. ACS1]